MSAHKCSRNQQNTLEVRQRYIPTFVHQPIFAEQSLTSHLTRNTPTFVSTVLDTDGYNVKTIHNKKINQPIRPNTALEKSVYINNTHEKRVQDLNPQSHAFYSSKDKWYDHTKQQMFQTIKDSRNHGYSRQRKHVDLSSDPVFTDYIYGLKGNLLPNHTCYIKNKIEVHPQVQQSNKVEQISDNIKQLQYHPNNRQAFERNQTNLNQSALPVEQQVQKVQNYKNQTKNQTLSKATKQDFNKNCVPHGSGNLKLKGKQVVSRPQSAQKSRIVSQKPTFTVIRKNRIPQP